MERSIRNKLNKKRIKLIKWAWWIALQCIVLPAIFLIFIIDVPTDNKWNGIIVLGLFMVPLLIAAVVGNMAQSIRYTIREEKARIWENKMKNYVRMFWEMLQRREYEEAKHIYNNFIDGEYKYVCNGLFTGFAYLDGSPDDYKKAIERMSKYTKQL